jgi:hypothetical protein
MTTMKRIAIAAVAVSALAFVGCKKKEEAPKTDPAADTAAGKPTDTATPTPAPADPAAAAPAAADPAAAAAAPAAAGDMTTGIAECDDLVKRYTACEKLPAEQKTAFLKGAEAWKTQAATGSEDVKKATADACKQAATNADAALKASGC